MFCFVVFCFVACYLSKCLSCRYCEHITCIYMYLHVPLKQTICCLSLITITITNKQTNKKCGEILTWRVTITYASPHAFRYLCTPATVSRTGGQNLLMSTYVYYIFVRTIECVWRGRSHVGLISYTSHYTFAAWYNDVCGVIETPPPFHLLLAEVCGWSQGL